MQISSIQISMKPKLKKLTTFRILISFLRNRYRRIVITVILCSIGLWYLYPYSISGDNYNTNEDVPINFLAKNVSAQKVSEVSLDKCPPRILDDFKGEKYANQWFFDALASNKLTESYTYRNFMNDYSQKMKISNEKMLYVHLVPFSHNDPGWLTTYDMYTRQTDNQLNLMLKYMRLYPDITYTFNEMVFFEHWWRNTSQTDRDYCIELLNNGRLELTSGTWTTPDEASTYYWALIDNIVEGQQFIKQELDTRFLPQVEWQNDAFGLSPTPAYLLKLANLSSIVIGRVPELTKMMLMKEKSYEFHWHQYFDKNHRYKMYTHVLNSPNYYTADTCGTNEQICCQLDFTRMSINQCRKYPLDVQNVHDDTLEALADLLTDQYRRLGVLYPHNHVLIPLGADFGFDIREHWESLTNYTKIFAFVNREKSYNMKVKFSTFKEYFAGAKKTLKMNDTVQTVFGDFYPCQDNSANTFWTGYFTSKPYFKRLDRQVQAMIRSADIYLSMMFLLRKIDRLLFSELFAVLRQAHRNLALFQHHDAITGTSVDFVAEDYGKKLKMALHSSANVLSRILQASLVKSDKMLRWAEESEEYVDILEVAPSAEIKINKDEKSSILTITNSLPYYRNETISIRVNTFRVKILGERDYPVFMQINPYVLPNTSVSQDTYEVLIYLRMGPLAVENLKIRFDDSDRWKNYVAKIKILKQQAQNLKFPKIFQIDLVPKLSLKASKTIIDIDDKTGYIKDLSIGGSNIKLNIDFWGYESTTGGVYIFGGGKAVKFNLSTEKNTFYVINGSMRQELHSYDQSRIIFHKVSLNGANEKDYLTMLDIENIVNVTSLEYYESVMRINSNIKNTKRTFYTDSNGFQFIKRVYNKNGPLETNYFPIASSIMLEDKGHRLTVLTAQPHGGTCPKSGSLEIMIHRRLYLDDYRGAGMLTDPYPTKANFRLLIEPALNITENEHAAHSVTAQQNFYFLLYKPVVFFSQNPEDSEIVGFNPLKTSFPCDLHFLNIRPFDTDGRNFGLLLHRLHNNCPKNAGKYFEDCNKQDGLNELLRFLRIDASLQPCTLAGIPIKAKRRMSNLTDFRNAMQIMDIKMFCFTPSVVHDDAES